VAIILPEIDQIEIDPVGFPTGFLAEEKMRVGPGYRIESISFNRLVVAASVDVSRAHNTIHAITEVDIDGSPPARFGKRLAERISSGELMQSTLVENRSE